LQPTSDHAPGGHGSRYFLAVLSRQAGGERIAEQGIGSFGFDGAMMRDPERGVGNIPDQGFGHESTRRSIYLSPFANNTGQRRPSPASSPRPLRAGLTQGSAANTRALCRGGREMRGDLALKMAFRDIADEHRHVRRLPGRPEQRRECLFDLMRRLASGHAIARYSCEPCAHKFV
jgi:hypothetical protein